MTPVKGRHYRAFFPESTEYAISFHDCVPVSSVIFNQVYSIQRSEGLKEVIEISRNKKTRMVVEVTTVKDKKNRKGEPYKLSKTKHLSLKSKKKEKASEKE